MRLALLADLHGRLPEIPPCDLVLVAGDLCPGPMRVEGRWRPDLSDDSAYNWLCRDFSNWTARNPGTVVVAGNHDTAVQARGFPPLKNTIYLQDSWCVVNGLHIWGTPWIPTFDHLAFNLDDGPRGDKIDVALRRDVEHCVDVLLCHAPPHGVADKLPDGTSFGCRHILRFVRHARPRLVVCGHAHEAAGTHVLRGGTVVVNAARQVVVVDLE